MGWSALREKHGYRLAGRYWPGFLLLVDTFADWFGSHGLLSFVCDHEDVMGSYVYIHIYTMASERVNEYQRSAVRGGLFLTNESFRLLACLLACLTRLSVHFGSIPSALSPCILKSYSRDTLQVLKCIPHIRQ
jgi:hypothetical protein